MKKFWKENKILIVLAIIILIALVAMGVGLFKYFYGFDTDVYGNRLNGIENYKLSDNLSEDIKSLYESGVKSVKVDLRGKIVYILIDVENDTSKDTAKDYAIEALDKFTDEEKEYYDIQFVITKSEEEVGEDETPSFPVEGYKNSSSLSVVWTNN